MRCVHPDCQNEAMADSVYCEECEARFWAAVAAVSLEIEAEDRKAYPVEKFGVAHAKRQR